MGFIRHQEEQLAIRFLTWQYQKKNIPVPKKSELERQAVRIVDDAHRIARERGRNVMSIIKELIDEVKKQ
jgi:hypothetical protein